MCAFRAVVDQMAFVLVMVRDHELRSLLRHMADTLLRKAPTFKHLLLLACGVLGRVWLLDNLVVLWLVMGVTGETVMYSALVRL